MIKSLVSLNKNVIHVALRQHARLLTVKSWQTASQCAQIQPNYFLVQNKPSVMLNLSQNYSTKKSKGNHFQPINVNIYRKTAFLVFGINPGNWKKKYCHITFHLRDLIPGTKNGLLVDRKKGFYLEFNFFLYWPQTKKVETKRQNPRSNWEKMK